MDGAAAPGVGEVGEDVGARRRSVAEAVVMSRWLGDDGNGRGIDGGVLVSCSSGEERRCLGGFL